MKIWKNYKSYLYWFGKMWRRILSLHKKFYRAHFLSERPGFILKDDLGQQIGYVDKIILRYDSLQVDGWSISEKISFTSSCTKKEWAKPDIHRSDVIQAFKLPPKSKPGFSLVTPGNSGNFNFCVSQNNCVSTFRIRGISVMHQSLEILKITLYLIVLLFLNFGKFLRAYVHPSTQNIQEVKSILGISGQLSPVTLNPNFFDTKQQYSDLDKITIILPVFNALGDLQECLKRLVDHTDVPWRLIVVEDCSTDVRVRLFLKSWTVAKIKAGFDIILLENEENLGFVRSVNLAFSRARAFSNHLVLLNSDAFLPRDWARRLLHPIEKNSRVASVTPLSNNAEIFSAPHICERSHLADGQVDHVDKFLRQYVSNSYPVSAPTGVGFCMAINRNFLEKIPFFDTEFGRGYGEEVDWCQKASALGGLHMCQPSLFVEHSGSSSFGEDAKSKLVQRHNEIISQRHQDYNQSVQGFISSDPLFTVRFFIAMCLVGMSEESIDIVFAHSMGGGADKYLDEYLKDRNAQKLSTVVIRVGGQSRFSIELHSTSRKLTIQTDDVESLIKLLSPVQKRRLMYSCVVGDSNPIEIPKIICSMKKDKDDAIIYLVHDYFGVSPSYCLLDKNQKFDGVPDSLDVSKSHSFQLSCGKSLSLREWRAAWGALIESSDEVRCFSRDSANIIGIAYPQALHKISILAHESPRVDQVPIPQFGKEKKIGILGGIGVQKGAQIVSDLSRLPYSGHLKGLVVVGEIAPEFSLGKNGIETGPYKQSEIADLATSNGVVCWLIPSIWPETFSYTTHEALNSGLIVFCFDLGAQAEAVKKHPNGHVLDLELASKPEELLAAIEEVVNDVKRRGDINRKSA